MPWPLGKGKQFIPCSHNYFILKNMNLEFCLSHKCATQVNDFELCRTYRWAAKAGGCLRKKNSIWNNRLNQLWLFRNEITRLKDFLQKYFECLPHLPPFLCPPSLYPWICLFSCLEAPHSTSVTHLLPTISTITPLHFQIMSTWASPLIYSFLILSILVIPNENVKVMWK